ncbi:putative wall-associated receptor kinase, galacturonan-binding domain-containing protein [Medicago truncatula]|uniref:Putative wall-associated receptor kinase, galacturonan-binding domain-containing protein n=1 Tax=Medicago truncatula TaxID=3880 RepID=A0A396JNG6_MEDTR|nr:uncharacterized protein LOC25482350 isoform X2 [Medicago truncatula]RHN77808.1 putative wall-associated receptor kinase, galacturonan-binding domain-containing protein [Medicago truncatula]
MESSVCFLQTTVVILILVYHHHHQTCEATNSNNNQTNCPPSSCGKLTNIKHPFRLKNDPTTCGDPRYELSCVNNITTLTLLSGNYNVKSINYDNYTIRLVDPGIQEDDCFSIPRYFLTKSNFTSYYSNSKREDPYGFDYASWFEYITYLNCSKPVKDDPDYVDTAPCRVNWDSNSTDHVYVIARRISARKLNIDCHVKLVAMSAAPAFISRSDQHHFSYAEIHGMLSYGFEISWITRACEDFCDLKRQDCSMDRINTGPLICLSRVCTAPFGYNILCGESMWSYSPTCIHPLVVVGEGDAMWKGEEE